MHPIGVFDSGLGGLSVLRALRAELPLERFVYVADSGHAPYGERDDDYLIHRSGTISRWLQSQHQIKALVVACNTATAAAIHVLRAEHPGLPIIGIEPALKPAVAASQTGVIGVMATPSTLKSEKFQRLLASLQGQARFVLQPCPGLALAIEQLDATKTGAACATFTGAMGTFGTQTGEMDTLVLGCTHYPFAESPLRMGTGDKVRYLEGGAPVARQTRRLLAKADLLQTQESPDAGRIDFHSTGDPQTLARAAEHWLGISDTAHELRI
ncbi:glutamate racemase [Rhodoferax sp. TBRC 17198]|uniref:glutamate racemase n=1 Tax=Rhodoferax potami TaxID=3068338 RepID=UPI0028BE1832|nr:glutamate racemase [Rhodoferax sp. TBRC 17198]MDT7522347.1 glutamate racemase [Rhodoferax sp. TBRC 17198]